MILTLPYSGKGFCKLEYKDRSSCNNSHYDSDLDVKSNKNLLLSLTNSKTPFGINIIFLTILLNLI